MPLPNWIIIDAPASTVWSDPAVPESLLRSIAANPGKLIQAAACRPVKIGRESLIVEAELTVGDRSLPVAVKQYRPRTLGKALAAIFRPAKAMRELAKGRVPALARHCHPAAVACLPAARLDDFGHQFPGHRSGSPARRTCISSAGESPRGRSPRDFASPHDVPRRWAGCSGGCMPPARPIAISRPPICSWSKTAGDVIVYLVDLDGLQPGGQVGFQRQARDLARLAAGLAAHPWVTRSICRRFLRAYLEEFPGSIDWKPLWRRSPWKPRIVAASKRGEQVL